MTCTSIRFIANCSMRVSLSLPLDGSVGRSPAPSLFLLPPQHADCVQRHSERNDQALPQRCHSCSSVIIERFFYRMPAPFARFIGSMVTSIQTIIDETIEPVRSFFDMETVGDVVVPVLIPEYLDLISFFQVVFCLLSHVVQHLSVVAHGAVEHGGFLSHAVIRHDVPAADR